MFASIFVVSSCAKEDAITPTKQSEAGKYDFPENTKYDDITLSIYEKSGVQILWTKVKNLDVNRDWTTNEISLPKRCRIVSEEQASESIHFLNDYIFNKLDPKLFNKIMKPYLYVVDDLHKPTNGGTLQPLNFDLKGMDCWIFSFFGEGVEKYPSYKTSICVMPKTEAEIFTYRRRVFFALFSELIVQKHIVIPSVFGTDFDYKTRLNMDPLHKDFSMNRGFCGVATLSSGRISALTTNAKNMTDNFLSYVCLAATFSREEMTNGAAYPFYTNGSIIPYKGYSRVLQYYDFVYNYILTEYGYDLAQLHSLK